MTIAAIVRNVPPKRGKGRPAGSPNKPKPDDGTPQTLANRVPDAIFGLPGVLDSEGKAKYPGLPQELQHAAVAISTAYWRLCGKLMAKASKLAPASPGKEAEFDAPILILILRYQAWMTEATRRRLHTESLIDMIVDRHHPDWCDRFHRFLPGSSDAMLRAGLKLYTQTRVQGLEAKLRETGDNHGLTGGAVL